MPNGSGNGLPGSDTAPGATGRQHPRTFLLSLSEQQKSRTMAKQEKTKAKSTGTAARLFAGRKIGETERWIYGFLLLFVSLFFLLAVLFFIVPGTGGKRCGCRTLCASRRTAAGAR